MRKVVKLLVIEFLLIMILLNLTMAFGATPPYWKDHPLIMSPGEEKIIPIILQNMVGDKDATLRVKIIQGKEIAEILDPKEYLVPLGRNDIEVNLRVFIPKDAKNNKQYAISLSFTEIPKDEGKMLQLSSAVTTSFPVIIREQEVKKQFSTLLISIILVIITTILILIVTLSLIRKKKSF